MGLYQNFAELRARFEPQLIEINRKIM